MVKAPTEAEGYRVNNKGILSKVVGGNRSDDPAFT
jgi:hypothetical protein